MKDENNLREFLNDPLLSDYLSLNDSLIRLAASRIFAESEIIRKKAFDNKPLSGETERILAMCTRLMQVSELYSMLTGVIADKPCLEVLELSDFLEKFTDKCSKLLDGVCRFETTSTKKIFIDASNDVLRYILLSFVRYAILKGADTIRFDFGCSDGKCSITATSNHDSAAEYGRFKFFQYVHSEEILATLAARIGAVCEFSETSIKLEFNERTNISESELRSPLSTYEPSMFSEYNIMLGDLGVDLMKI